MSAPQTAPAQLGDPDAALLDGLRTGDEAAFAALIDRYAASMQRVAMLYVGSRAVAEEVVQDTWLGVLTGIGRFEGRSTLKTWIFRILTNRAKTRGEREGRTIPFASLADEEGAADPVVDQSRFNAGDDRWAGHWASPPRSLDTVPEERLLAREARQRIAAAIAELPEGQRAVITLRDVDGFSSEEACELLGISEVNQRVLLHRARGKVRAALEGYVEEGEP